MKKYALVTVEGTAAGETTLCGHCFVDNMIFTKIPPDVKDPNFRDVTDNDECTCIICGFN